MDELIRPLYKYVRAGIVDGLSKAYDGVSITRLGLLISYLTLMFIIVLFLWRPFLVYLDTDDMKSKRMLAILPLSVMLKVKNIHKYLEGKAVHNKR